MHIVKRENGKILSLPAEEISLKKLRHLNSDLVFQIIDTLKGKELYPKQIAQQLGVHEQKVYYHIRHMEEAGFIINTKTERIMGSYAKYYKLTKKGFFFRFGEFEVSPRILELKDENGFLKPFIDGGKMNALIITGSPDPHGPDKARSRDGYYGIDLGLFFGTFLNYVPKPNVKLDTETQESDLRNNLILIGGPIVNKITERVNKGLPIRFEKTPTWTIKSSITGNNYPEDEMGIIVKARNPYNLDAYVLIIAGKRHSGTRAAIIAMLKYFYEVTKGNKYNNEVMARVVEGIDLDSDGIIDDVEFKE
ncbi:hypothetical protein DRJ48_03315 [Candidatus Woesearchaeota archaeon]|nr:S-layer protein [Candidatus Woesearchaeota archaeon]RLE42552.1 MAG: hypothetical protein DRJ48_03315 [Candidatus Woesearchaeota archaeon]